MILKKDNPVDIGRMFDHIAWQLTNLYELQHPYADRVRQILEKYWYNPDTILMIKHLLQIFPFSVMSCTKSQNQ